MIKYSKMGHNKLTAKQEDFAQLVAKGSTYVDSYKKAYGPKDNVTINSLYVRSSELMSNSKILVRVSELRQGAVKRSEVDLDRVLYELASWLLFDPITLIDEDTDAIKPLRDMDKRARMSLSEIHVQEIFGMEPSITGTGKIKVKTGELKKIKFVDKKGTADLFLKHFGAYVNTKEETNDTLEHISEIIKSITNNK